MERLLAETLAKLDARFPDERVAARMRRMRIESVADIARIAESSQGPIAGLCCWLLGKFGGEEAEDALLRILAGPRRSLWRQAAASLGEAGTERSVPALIGILRGDGHNMRREGCAYALGHMDRGARREDAAEALIQALNRADAYTVAAQAAESLGYVLKFGRSRLKPVARRVLIRKLNDRMPEVRFWSAFALGTLRSQSAIPALKRLAEDPSVVPGWWSVGTEARDALKVIAGGKRPDRVGRKTEV